MVASQNFEVARQMNPKYLLFLGPEDRAPRKRYVTVSFRAPRCLLEEGHAKARAEDLSFSQFMRRGIRRALLEAEIPIESDLPREPMMKGGAR